MLPTTHEHDATALTTTLEHILVVDDDVLIRESLFEFFNGEGFVCEAAENGREALHKLLSKEFALVISDINMPEMSGLQLLEHLSRNFPDVAVMMITAQDDVETAVLAMRQGAADYIIKPFNLDRILSKVNRTLRRRLHGLGQPSNFYNPESTIPVTHSPGKTPIRRVNSQSGQFSKRDLYPVSEERVDAPPQRRLAAIMFTDIVNYCALTQRNEDLALTLLEEHQTLIRSICLKYQGQEIKSTGDGFLIEFGSALEAARCAIEMQRRLAERNQIVQADSRIQIRIGLHLGDVVHRENDIFGDGVNIASRLEGMADPEGICISEDLAHQIQNKIEEPIVKLAPSTLKNIHRPMDIFKIVL
ncbi:MAG: response regulator [Acidobacteriota bacterium]